MEMTKLKQYQIEGVEGIYNFRGRCLLADDQGLGKTIQALDWIRRTDKYRPAVIVCPSSVKYTWQAEAMDHFGMRSVVLDGRKPKKVKTIQGSIIILNYDILDSWVDLIKSLDPQTVVFDEIQYLKDPKSQRTKASRKLVKNVRSRLGLSGTVFNGDAIGLWSIIKILRPDIFPSIQDFAWKYTRPKFTPWGWRYRGAVNTNELHAILADELMVRRLKKDVAKEIPDKIRCMVTLKLKSYVEYNKAENDIVAWLRKISPSRANRASKAKAMVRVGYLMRLVAELKLPMTTKWVEEFLERHPDRKLVLLTMHSFVIEHFKERFPNSVVIDGKVRGKQRHLAVKKFQTNDKCRLLFGNWIAAGVGITLHKAQDLVSHDTPFTPDAMLQGEDRIHRIGQSKEATIHYLAVMNTLEEKYIKILKRRAKVLDAVLNGKRSNEDLDLFGELLSEIA